VHAVYGAAAGVGGDHGKQRGIRDAEADLFAFHVSARLTRRRRALDPEFAEVRIPALFGRIGHKHAGQEQDAHRSKDGPALPRITDHLAERIGEAGWNYEDQNHLQEIRKRRGVLVGVRRVGVEEASAIDAEHFDHFLRSSRPLRDSLCSAFQSGDLRVGSKILNHTLRDQHEGPKDRNREQDVDQTAGQIDPKVPHRFHRMPRKAANHGDARGQPHRRGKEVMRGQTGHLGEIAHGRLGHVRLPVGVGGEAHGRVEGRIGADRPQALWVPRQPLLQALERVGDQQCRDREQKNAARVARPMLLGALVDSAEFVDGNFEGPQKAVHERTLALKDSVHVEPQRFGQRK
jgi:hypothetical protein